MTRENETAAQRQRRILEAREDREMPGFDPAMAPLETDAEASGNATDRPIIPPRDDPTGSANATSFGSVIHSPEATVPPDSNYTTIISVAVIAIAVILAAIMIW